MSYELVALNMSGPLFNGKRGRWGIWGRVGGWVNSLVFSSLRLGTDHYIFWRGGGAILLKKVFAKAKESQINCLQTSQNIVCWKMQPEKLFAQTTTLKTIVCLEKKCLVPWFSLSIIEVGQGREGDYLLFRKTGRVLIKDVLTKFCNNQIQGSDRIPNSFNFLYV